MNTENTILDKINNWVKNSVMLKLISITFLMLFLLIPANMIMDIVHERESLNKEVASEINSKWANEQLLNGPVLTIPVLYEFSSEDKLKTETRYWNILPETLIIDGKIDPKILHRGIYNVAVYTSEININGEFILNQKPDPNGLKDILYNQAFITLGISDLRGIKKEIIFDWDGNNLPVNPGSKLGTFIPSGVNIENLKLSDEPESKYQFSTNIIFQGSSSLAFTPLGSNTKVKLKSEWKSPSFKGNFLPDQRKISENGFEADWSVLKLNRNFPQSWLGNDYINQIQYSTFGVDLLLPMDDYQKSYRSARYAAMTIALTFLIFFLVEIINKIKIHPFQYALVGLSLCLFYILLLSISEHIAFNNAFVISTVSIVAMISFYSLSVFKVKKLTFLLSSALIAIYAFLFVTLQMSDYALLMGSIGLTIILALTMYFTRNIDWYKMNISSNRV